MSNSAVHHIAKFLMETRTNPSNLGYSASEFWSDVEDAIPKKAKKKAKKKVKKVINTAKKAVNQQVDSALESTADKASSFIESKTGYKPPENSSAQTQVASDDVIDEETLEANAKASEDAEKAAYEAKRKKYQRIALTSALTVGGLTALYFVFKKD